MDEAPSAGQSAEFRTALVELIPHLRAFARSLTRNREQADDLVHDAVVRALTAADQFQPGTNFKAWMFTILRNLYYNEGRKERAKSLSLDGLAKEVQVAPATQEAALELRDFRRAYWQLGAAHREVLILVGAGGLSYEEAAKVCNCAVGTIKSRVSRARHELTRLLAGDAPGDTRPAATQGAEPPPEDSTAQASGREDPWRDSDETRRRRAAGGGE